MLAISILKAPFGRFGILLVAGALSTSPLVWTGKLQAQIRYQLEDDVSQVQQVAYHGCRPHCNCPQCQQNYVPYPQGTMPGYQQPGAPSVPSVPSVPETGAPPPPTAQGSPGAEGYAAVPSGGPSPSGVGPAYIDDARIWNLARFRFDAGYDNEFPDRAEFFYPQCGCFGGNSPGPGDDNPPTSSSSVDFQEYTAYLECMVTERFSLFIDVPVRSIDPSISDEAASGPANFLANENATGLSDIIAGFKLALVACPWHYDTIQLKIYNPTGEGDRGLGTEHFSIEPAYLAYRELSDCCRLNGEFRVWVPISDTRLDLPGDQFDGELWAGTILRYGLGVTYDLHQCYDCCGNITNRCSAVFEAVGWSVLDGLKFRPDSEGGNVFDASGDNIFILKLGGRWTCCDTSLYVGYGHAVTEQAWYRDIIRAEVSYLY